MALSTQRMNKAGDEGELKPLFERPTISQINPVDQKWFAQLGRCQGFEARPAVMHFDGFQTGKIHTQYIKILNVSQTPKRMHIINPTTKEFTVRVEKRGVLAPGMAETIAIDFEPNEWRYHYDCIRIYTEADNLLVPIHGYPVVNVVNFPTQIDFGECPLREGKRKVISLGCKVPIQFEYKIEITKHNPDFIVKPIQGLIPANGIQEISIDFIPLNFGTCHLEFVLHVSQFNFKPITCCVTASCVPGLIRDRALDMKASLLLKTKGSNLTLGSEPTSMLSPNTFGFKLSESGQMEGVGNGETSPLSTILHDATMDLMDTNLPISNFTSPKGLGSGAVLDGGADMLKQASRSSSSYRIKKPKPYIPAEKLVEGLLVPNDLTTTQSINYILTQKAGKLKPKALQGAIKHQRAVRAEQLKQQAMIRSAVGGSGGGSSGGNGLSVHAIKAEEGSVVSKSNDGGSQHIKQPRQAREMAFLHDLNEASKSEKSREFKSSQEAIGSKQLSPEEIDMIISQRSLVEKQNSLMKRSESRSIIHTKFKGPYVKDVTMKARAETIAHVKPSCISEKPLFDVNAQNVWSKRRKTLQKCIYLVGKWITRRRADRRLEAIKNKLSGCNSREAVRALVELDNQQAASGEGGVSAGGSNSGGGGGNTLTSTYISPAAQLLADMGVDGVDCNKLRFQIGDSSVQPSIFPGFEEDSGTVWSAVDSGWTPSISFHDISYLEARTPKEAELMGYAHVSSPPVDSFAPYRDRRGIRVGATEESGVRAPRGENTLVRDIVPAPPNTVETGDLVSNSDGDVSKEESASKVLPPPPPPPTDVTTIMDVLFIKNPSKDYEVKPILQSFQPLDRVNFNSNKLRPSQEYKVYNKLSIPLETDMNWCLRPQVVEYEIPADYGCRIANSIGSSTLHAFKNIPTQSSFGWRQRRDRRASTLQCLPEQHLQTLWQHRNLPLISLKGGDVGDEMSDSESDDELGDHVTIPTIDLARGYFDPDLDEIGEELDVHVEETTAVIGGDRLIMRDVMMLKLEASKLEKRQESALELPSRMEAIGDQVVNLSNKFLLQKPYHVIKK